jgi:hypothetical protein
MKPTLLLSDKSETARLMLQEVTSGRVAVRESEARAGCNCDRWGHPYARCLQRNKPNKSRRSDFITSQKAR